MSRELPILFTADMVRLLLSGAKTQTRRPVKPQPPAEIGGALTGGYWFPTHDSGDPAYKRARCYDGEAHFRRGMPIDFAPWRRGDVLYVRETWAEVDPDHGGGLVYAADYQPPSGGDYGLWRHRMQPQTWFGGPWRPSIHMKKEHARIRLRVVSVSVERVNAISEEDAAAEGCKPSKEDHVPLYSHRATFERLWNHLYGAGSFDSGAWCWVTRFEVVR